MLAVATPDKPAVPAPAALQRRSSDGGGAPARLAFRDEEGQIIKPMPADYGFRSGSGRLYQRVCGAGGPAGWWSMCHLLLVRSSPAVGLLT